MPTPSRNLIRSRWSSGLRLPAYRPSSTDRNTPSISTALPVAGMSRRRSPITSPRRPWHGFRKVLNSHLGSRSCSRPFAALPDQNLYSSYGEVLREMAERLSAPSSRSTQPKRPPGTSCFSNHGAKRPIQLMLPAGLDLCYASGASHGPNRRSKFLRQPRNNFG